MDGNRESVTKDDPQMSEDARRLIKELKEDSPEERERHVDEAKEMLREMRQSGNVGGGGGVER